METAHTNPTLYDNVNTFFTKVRKTDNTLQIQMGDGKNGIVLAKKKGFLLLQKGVQIDCCIRGKDESALSIFERMKNTSFATRCSKSQHIGELSEGANIFIAYYGFDEMQIVYNDLVELSCVLFDCQPEEIKSGFYKAW